jgi:pantoate kinase
MLNKEEIVCMALHPYVALDAMVRGHGNTAGFELMAQYALLSETLCKSGLLGDWLATVQEGQAALLRAAGRVRDGQPWVLRPEDHKALRDCFSVYFDQLGKVSTTEVLEAYAGMNRAAEDRAQQRAAEQQSGYRIAA